MLDEEIHTLSLGKWKGIFRRKKHAAFQDMIDKFFSKDRTKLFFS